MLSYRNVNRIEKDSGLVWTHWVPSTSVRDLIIEIMRLQPNVVDNVQEGDFLRFRAEFPAPSLHQKYIFLIQQLEI